MTGVGLSYNGRQLLLDEAFTIDWQVEDDLLDLDRLGQGHSWPIQIPIRGNEWVFLFASDPARSKNMFKTYDGFAITFGGNLWWSCSLDLLGVTDDGLFYEAELSTVESAIMEVKDKSIREVINATIALPDATGLPDPITFTEIDAEFNTETSGMVFPMVHFYGKKRILNKANSFLLPFFRLDYLLKVLAESIEYRFVNDYKVSTSNVSRIVIFHNRILPTDSSSVTELTNEYTFEKLNYLVQVGNYLPDFTVADFLKEAAYLTGSSLEVDAEEKTITLSSVRRGLTGTANVLDITADTSDQVVTTRAQITNIKLTWENISEDETLTVPDILEGNYVGEYDSRADYVAASGKVDNDYAFCLLENSYYKYTDADGVNFYADPFQEYSTGGENVLEIPIKSVPCRKDRYSYSYFEKPLTITDNGAGKVRITGTTTSMGISTSDKVRIKESSSTPSYSQEFWLQVLTVTSTYIDLTIDHVIDADLTAITVQQEENYYFPVVGGVMHYPENQEESLTFAGRVAIWHGKQAPITGGGTYAYASCDNYKSDGSAVRDYSLRFTQTDNMFESVYEAVYNLVKESRIVKLYTDLSVEDIKTLFQKRKRARFKRGIIRVRQFRGTLQGGRIRNQEIEGYLL